MPRYQSATAPLSLDYDGYGRAWINLVDFAGPRVEDVQVVPVADGEVTLCLDKDGRLIAIEIDHPEKVLTASTLAKLGLERS